MGVHQKQRGQDVGRVVLSALSWYDSDTGASADRCQVELVPALVLFPYAVQLDTYHLLLFYMFLTQLNLQLGCWSVPSALASPSTLPINTINTIV